MGAKATTGLESIPGVGPSIAKDLRSLGYRDVTDLRDADPEEMYDPELLKWWAWKDRTL